MLKIVNVWALSALLAVLSGCGGSDSAPQTGSGNAAGGVSSGALSLSGDDVAVVGDTLDTGYVGMSPAVGSSPDFIIIVDSNSTVIGSGISLVPQSGDTANAVVMVVTDALTPGISQYKGISMFIIKNGVRFDYTCSTPASSSGDCGFGTISLDMPGRSVTFNKATVQNDMTGAILEIDGQLSW